MVFRPFVVMICCTRERGIAHPSWMTMLRSILVGEAGLTYCVRKPAYPCPWLHGALIVLLSSLRDSPHHTTKNAHCHSEPSYR